MFLAAFGVGSILGGAIGNLPVAARRRGQLIVAVFSIGAVGAF
jgi:hypothetical protein